MHTPFHVSAQTINCVCSMCVCTFKKKSYCIYTKFQYLNVKNKGTTHTHTTWTAKTHKGHNSELITIFPIIYQLLLKSMFENERKNNFKWKLGDARSKWGGQAGRQRKSKTKTRQDKLIETFSANWDRIDILRRWTLSSHIIFIKRIFRLESTAERISLARSVSVSVSRISIDSLHPNRLICIRCSHTWNGTKIWSKTKKNKQILAHVNSLSKKTPTTTARSFSRFFPVSHLII